MSAAVVYYTFSLELRCTAKYSLITNVHNFVQFHCSHCNNSILYCKPHTILACTVSDSLGCRYNTVTESAINARIRLYINKYFSLAYM